MISERLKQQIQAVDPVQGLTIASYESTVAERDAPPFKRFHLLVIRVRMPTKMIELRYATDGDIVLPAEGPEAIARLVREEGLRIDQGNVADYVRFYLHNTQPGSFSVVESPEEVRWMSDADAHPETAAAKERAEFMIRPLQAREAPDGAFDVKLTAVDQRTLYMVTLRVWPEGRVDGPERKALATDIPVPYVRVW